MMTSVWKNFRGTEAQSGTDVANCGLSAEICGRTLTHEQREDAWKRRDIYATKFDLVRLKELLEVGIAFKERDRVTERHH